MNSAANIHSPLALGKAAFLRGAKRVPAQDRALLTHPDFARSVLASLDLWIKGWDLANLAADVTK